MEPLKRKIDRTLVSWKAMEGHKPLVIKGCRQCGKTFSVMQFARKNYKNVVYLNFVEHDNYKLAFEQSKAVDDIIMNISAMIPKQYSKREKRVLSLTRYRNVLTPVPL